MIDAFENARLSFKSGIFYSGFDEGIVLRGGPNPLVIRGRRAYQLVEVLGAHMTAGRTAGEIVAAFPAPVQPTVIRVLADMRDHDLVRTRDAGDTDPDSALVAEFADLWNFIADHTPTPGAVFDAWRQTVFHLWGAGEARALVARALAECAAEHIVFMDGNEAAPTGAVPAVTIICMGDDTGPLPDTGAGPAWYFGPTAGHLLVARLAGDATATLSRWHSRLKPDRLHGVAAAVPPSRVALGAAALAFHVFKAAVGAPGALAPGSAQIVTPAAQLTDITPPVDAAVQADTAHIPATGEPDDNVLAPLFDPVTGIFEECEDGTPQVPLSVVRLEVTHEPGRARSVVTGWGLSRQDAMMRAVCLGLDVYLRHAPSLGGRFCGFEVGYSMSRCRADAQARLIAAAATPAFRPVALDTIEDAQAYKLFKLLGLHEGAAPQVELWSAGDDNPAAVARVTGAFGHVFEACRADEGQALKEALGRACLHAQLSRCGLTPDGPAAHVGVRDGQTCVAIDSGFRIPLHCIGIGEAQ